MNRIAIIAVFFLLFACRNEKNAKERIAVAQIGNVILYYDEIPNLIQRGINEPDSAALIQNYINKWAKRELVLQKAEENLTPELKDEIDMQTELTRANLVIYQYQRQMMLEKMDTTISETELENYYTTNESSFILNSNIVKALFIRLPVETPNLEKIKVLIRSNEQKDIQQLETYSYQFAETYDDFGEKWVGMNRITLELGDEIVNEESFLKKNTYYETSDSSTVLLLSIRDYRLRSSLAPYEYVRDDIKRIIWNTRRFDFIQDLENGIYNDALKRNSFKIF
jgi:hypothetical protein